MTKALLIIDYTNDFIADNGSLTCGKPAQDSEDYLIATLLSKIPILIITYVNVKSMIFG